MIEERPLLIRKLDELGFLNDEKSIDLYLPLLGSAFLPDKKEDFFSKFRRFAVAVKHDDKFIRELIRDENWRPTIVGTALAILLRKNDLQFDMIWRIENRNWVAPQLSVGVAILDEGKGRIELVRFLHSASVDSNPKSVLSVYSALKFMECPEAGEFEKTELFSILNEKDSWDGSVRIASEHWDYWKDVEPIGYE